MSDRAVDVLDQAAHRRRVQNAIIGIAIVTVLGVIAVGLIISAMALSKIEATSDYLRECTTPSTDVEFHRCYEDGQRSTAEVVGQIIDSQDYNSLLLVCLLSFAPDERTDQDIDRCKATSRAEIEGRE